MAKQDDREWTFLILALAFALPFAVYSSILVSSRVTKIELAGRFVSTQVAGEQSGAMVGITMSGQPGIVLTPNSIRSLVSTDRELISTDGLFTGKIGEQLEVRTMLDGSKKLCVSGNNESCKPILK
jgi:hypothetical protein